jgi:hypothetical protein
MFEEITGEPVNYFGTNCMLEVGSNFLRLKDSQTSTAFLFNSLENLEKLFGDQHPLIQKYYSYSSEVASQADENDTMMVMARKQFEIIERSNVSKNSTPSLFLLDGLLQLISMLC